MNVWMLKWEDLTELGEMDFTLWVDEKSAMEAMEADVRKEMENWGVGEDAVKRGEHEVTMEASHVIVWNIRKLEVKGGNV